MLLPTSTSPFVTVLPPSVIERKQRRQRDRGDRDVTLDWAQSWDLDGLGWAGEDVNVRGKGRPGHWIVNRAVALH